MGPRSSPNDGSSDEPEYDNPPISEGINSPEQSRPLRDFFFNLSLVLMAIVVFFAALELAARGLAPYIPFHWERSLVGKNLFQSILDSEGEEKQREIRRIATAVTEAMDLPAGMELSVFYNPADTINAFASFGGNIVVFQGLLDILHSEDELAMVLAHEVAHVKHRDIAKGLVRAAGLMLLSSGLQSEGALLEVASRFGLAGYSRAQESAADMEAVKALGRVYGHTSGTSEFFRTLAIQVEKRPSDAEAPYFSGLTASHPDTLYRLKRCNDEAARLGIEVKGELTPLPPVLKGNAH